MLRIIRSTLVFAALGVLPSVAIPAQPNATLQGTPTINADDRVLNAPYSAQRRFTYDKKSADGTINRAESGGSKARDSQGRTYSADERHWTYLEGNKRVLKSEMLYRIHDPVANTDTNWDSTSKEVKVIHWPQRASAEDASKAQCPVACLEAMMSPLGDVVEKLGVKNFGSIVAEGTRNSYTVPAGQDHNDQPIVVVHESWYSPELKIVILETNDDPRSGKSRDELVVIVRGEPDVRIYHPPGDSVVHDIHMP
jgi:hypothetical protein